MAAGVIQDPSELAVGIWILGIAFPWGIGRAGARQAQLVAELEATRRELAEQAVQTERRQIARDVHDFVGHGLAAVMLQVTGARHVLRRDPAAAEEALRSAEDLGRRSMHELRRTVALLRSDDESAGEVPALVDHARAGGLDVDLEMRGDLSRIAPGVGVALYRIAQEALANAARHAPRARTDLRLEVDDGRARLVADTTGPTIAPAGETDRPCYGLVGMRERAAALGGELTAGLVDDQAIVRAGLARILSPADGFEVVAECVDGDEAVARIPALRPDVTLMDVRMPGLDGIAATTELCAADAGPILVLTTFGEDDVLWAAIEAGAAGFVLKDSSAEDLIAAVRAVAGGGAWLDLLTDREHDVLRLMARGATNAEIAAGLHVAEATVKSHVGSIFTKLDVRDRAAAIVFAYDHGVVNPGAS